MLGIAQVLRAQQPTQTAPDPRSECSFEACAVERKHGRYNIDTNCLCYSRGGVAQWSAPLNHSQIITSRSEVKGVAGWGAKKEMARHEVVRGGREGRCGEDKWEGAERGLPWMRARTPTFAPPCKLDQLRTTCRLVFCLPGRTFNGVSLFECMLWRDL